MAYDIYVSLWHVMTYHHCFLYIKISCYIMIYHDISWLITRMRTQQLPNTFAVRQTFRHLSPSDTMATSKPAPAKSTSIWSLKPARCSFCGRVSFVGRLLVSKCQLNYWNLMKKNIWVWWGCLKVRDASRLDVWLIFPCPRVDNTGKHMKTTACSKLPPHSNSIFHAGGFIPNSPRVYPSTVAHQIHESAHDVGDGDGGHKGQQWGNKPRCGQ